MPSLIISKNLKEIFKFFSKYVLINQQVHNGIYGSINDERKSKKLDGFTVFVENSDAFQTRVNKNGSFHLYVGPGHYRLKVVKPEYDEMHIVSIYSSDFYRLHDGINYSIHKQNNE